MPVLAFFSGDFCSAEQVAQQVAEKLDFSLIRDEIIEDAAQQSGISKKNLMRAMTGQPPFFNNLTHEREKSLIFLNAALAQRLKSDNMVYLGLAMHLIPKSIRHVLKICIVADLPYRLEQARQRDQLSAKAAQRRIEKGDLALANWTATLFRRGPWDPSLYDVKIPIHTTSVDQAVELVREKALKDAVRPSTDSLQAALDWILATQINLLLLEKGHYYCEVAARGGAVTVMINKNVLRLKPLEDALRQIVQPVDGVETVDIKVGPKFHQPDIIRSIEIPMPSKVLLVDDERDYVMTLSERLEMRDLKSDVVYDGEEALSYVEQQEPEVMVLDLRMPGMGGMEVLRQIKQKHPKVEVIILTGHGTDKDRQMAGELGAFAYMQKPVDIDVLVRTMREASAKAGGTARGKTAGGVDVGGEPLEDNED